MTAERGALLALVIAILFGCGPRHESAGPDSRLPTGEAPSSSEPSPPPVALGTASISGTVIYEGKVPRLRPVQIEGARDCEAQHSEPVPSQILVLGEGNRLANVLVQITAGLPDVDFQAPAEPVTMSQDGCIYEPHVVALMGGQTLEIHSSDGVLHLSGVDTSYRDAVPGRREGVEEFTFKVDEGLFLLQCDLHPWMLAYVGVVAHPYFAVTDTNGTFSLSGLPAGTYEVEAWHERLGALSGQVVVAESEAARLDFTFSR